MKRTFQIFMGAAVACGLAACSGHGFTASFDVIPAPQEVVAGKGASFVLTAETPIIYAGEDADMQRNAEFLAGYLGLSDITAEAADKGIRLERGLESENPEAYRLIVDKDGIVIEGASAAGVFYGIQTLRKAVPADWTEKVCIPAVTVNDAPRFAYRGAHFDPVRHFFTVDEIKTYIDMMALHNMNIFHWHLTDDQGWRIEIKKYPELTKVGAYRPNTAIGHVFGGADLDPNAKYDDQPVNGFFTQEQAKEIVKYAADRYITVIPEIEVPGHMVAALTTYPELGCTGGPYEVWRYWGVSEHLLCVGKPGALDFVDDIFREIVELFPSKYIHIGGDEAPKTQWAKCPRCQALIKKLGLTDSDGISKEDKLQGYVTNHVEQFLAQYGRRIIGWDEILGCGLSPDATVMSWQGEVGGIQAARLDHDVIMAPNSYFYFDYYQTPDVTYEPDAIGGNLPLAWVYSFNPMPEALNADEQKHILGVQANLWTEYISKFDHVQYMVLPRWAALAETQWSQQDKKDYDSFFYRLPQLMKWYDKEGYNYARHAYDVNGRYTAAGDNALKAELFTADNAPIYYTVDGTEPSEASTLYAGPFNVEYGTQVRAVVVRADGNSHPYQRTAGPELLQIQQW